MHSEAVPHFRGADLGQHGCLFFPGWLTMPAGFGFVFFFNLSKALPLSYILCVLGISISFNQSLTGFKVLSRQRTMRNMWKIKKRNEGNEGHGTLKMPIPLETEDAVASAGKQTAAWLSWYLSD